MAFPHTWEPFNRRVIIYFEGRIGELSRQIKEREELRAFYRELVQSFRPCPACKGYGKTRYQTDQDHFETLTCEACSGSGQLNDEGALSDHAQPTGRQAR